MSRLVTLELTEMLKTCPLKLSLICLAGRLVKNNLTLGGFVLREINSDNRDRNFSMEPFSHSSRPSIMQCMFRSSELVIIVVKMAHRVSKGHTTVPRMNECVSITPLFSKTTLK